MVNRIQKAWDDIIRWKKFFENLVSRGQVPADYLSSRHFKKDLFGRHKELLSRRYKDQTSEERSLRRFINRERQQLEKEIYPNVLIRFTRNLFRFGGALVMLPLRAISKPQRTARAAQTVGSDLERHGFGNLAPAVASRLRQGETSIRQKVSESTTPKEVIDYDLSVVRNGAGKHRFEGFSATLLTEDGKEKRSLSLEDSTGLTKEQAEGLLHGRPVNMGGDNWKIPDVNDADAQGNIRIREIRIADYDLEKSVAGIPGLKLSAGELSEMIHALRNGRRIDLSIGEGSQRQKVQLEAAPLQRGFQFFQNNKRTTPDRLLNKPEKGKTMKMEPLKVGRSLGR